MEWYNWAAALTLLVIVIGYGLDLSRRHNHLSWGEAFLNFFIRPFS